MPFAQVTRSGSIPQRVLANHSPVRPNPVITSSATNSTPVSRQTARASSRYPGGGAYTPPAPITGSQKNAATRSAPSRSIVARSSAASSHATSSTSGSSGPCRPLLPDVEEVAWDDAAELRATIERLGADRVAAFFCEPVIGAGGVYAPPPGYLEEARRFVARPACCSSPTR